MTERRLAAIEPEKLLGHVRFPANSRHAQYG
jgi:hypothetical protein